MASFFGEILESSSRAYDGDCEEISRKDDTSVPSCYDLSWKLNDKPAGGHLFIILDGKCSLGFPEGLRCRASLVAEITETKMHDDDQPWKASESPSYIYKLSNGIYLCEVSPDVKLINANYFSCKLNEILKKSKEVLILVSRPSLGYFPSHSDSFIRGLSNSVFSRRGGKLTTPIIDNGNIITGVAASVFLWCTLMKLSTSVYICYTPKEEMESVFWEFILNLTSSSASAVDFLSTINFTGKEKVARTGNLYL